MTLARRRPARRRRAGPTAAVLRRRPDGRLRPGHDRRQPARHRVHAARPIAASSPVANSTTGTSLLLRADPPLVPAGDVLDLGCGAGPIALTMARRSPERDGVGDRRQRTGPRAVPGERRRKRDHQHPRGGARRRARRCPVRHDLVEPADPHRQGGAARTAAALAARPRHPRASRRWSCRSTSAPTRSSIG